MPWRLLGCPGGRGCSDKLFHKDHAQHSDQAGHVPVAVKPHLRQTRELSWTGCAARRQASPATQRPRAGWSLLSVWVHLYLTDTGPLGAKAHHTGPHHMLGLITCQVGTRGPTGTVWGLLMTDAEKGSVWLQCALCDCGFLPHSPSEVGPTRPS